MVEFSPTRLPKRRVFSAYTKYGGGVLAVRARQTLVAGVLCSTSALAFTPPRPHLGVSFLSRTVFRNVLSVNWMRYKAGRKYPIPIKFINDDLNDNFRKGAYIRRWERGGGGYRTPL